MCVAGRGAASSESIINHYGQLVREREIERGESWRGEAWRDSQSKRPVELAGQSRAGPGRAGQGRAADSVCGWVADTQRARPPALRPGPNSQRYAPNILRLESRGAWRLLLPAPRPLCPSPDTAGLQDSMTLRGPGAGPSTTAGSRYLYEPHEPKFQPRP